MNTIKSLICIVFVCFLIKSNGFMFKDFKSKWYPKIIKNIGIAIVSSTLLGNPVLAVEDAFQVQLQAIKQQQIDQQKEFSQKKEEELMSKELLYPDGHLIGRGIVTLTPLKNGVAFDRLNFPYGVYTAADMDENLNTEKASLFLLAVGKEGPPLAAIRYKLSDIKFPFVFEITSDDLFFPYNLEAWKNSANSKDIVACTAILTPDDKLATPSDAEWVGFGLSNPIVIAGSNGRTSAKLTISTKIDKNLYTPTEITSLTNVDNEIERINSIDSKIKPSKVTAASLAIKTE